MSQTIKSLRSHAIAVLTQAGVPGPDVDAELLIAHVLGLTRGQV
ncbi:MAG TPA: peptide chain release factor N(5)-glutamine methyltransferase, partial [Pseudolysinimonas sp.]|nr:peptide chain release factor N(5)-glutamine methyltransferase [Pseudolysinimonas sp.]